MFINENTALACGEQLHEVFPNAIGISKTREQPEDKLDNEKVTNSKIEVLQKMIAYLSGFTIGVLIEYLPRVEFLWLAIIMLILVLVLSILNITTR